ncbi:hypothetical protein ACFRR7_34820 [Streptomyces sp. NPDC056909]|uniref:hypothetical protein n=1 Tax=Streptomyces sp. NPDC056909 TaxID=3345963 RepID=UPI0036AF7230
MSTIPSLADGEKLAQQSAKYHHPHFRGLSKDTFDRVAFDFMPFTGAEQEPTPPGTFWRDAFLSAAARDFLSAEYRLAHDLWRDAKYVRELKAAAAGADALWRRYVTARQEMDTAFTALETTADTHWRSAVSTLVTAQDTARAAADRWDEAAGKIAAVHDTFLYSDLSHDAAYLRAGVDPAGWVVGSAYDYRDYCGTPLVRQVSEATEAQREHLRKVAALTGDRSPV